MKVKLRFLTTLLVITTLFAAPFIGVQRAAALASTPTPELEPSPTGVYIIQLKDPAVPSYTGGLPGLAATNPQVNGESKLDVKAPAAVAYREYLSSKQAEFISTMESTLGRKVEIVFQYLNVLDAMAVKVDADEAASLLALPGVKSIQPEQISQLDTDVTPEFLGATDVWAGNVGAGEGTQGAGIIVGMIDTGINHAHPSFADIGGDGYDHTNPWGSGTYVGWCVSNPSFCNDKLIGAYGLLAGVLNPEDLNGHGSHTASTAAGNYHEAVFTVGATEITRTISGMAPHANLIAYQVCDEGGCYGSSILAAVDLAITNGVDVINYSIGPTGGAEPNPWTTYDDLAFLDATAAGIFVSTSAGNRGPADATLAHSGPWNVAVANTTTYRVVANTLDITGSAELTGLAAVQGDNNALLTEVSGEIAYDPTNLQGCTAFAGGFFSGKLALIQRGSCTFDVKIDNATTAGAVAVVVFNNALGGPSVMGSVSSPTPAVMLSLEDGTAVKDYIDANPGAQAVLNPEVAVVENHAWQDHLNSSSSRGPSRYDFLKPDYSAPGTNILAAVAAAGDPVQYGFYTGTSMAAPHSAGAAGLLMSLHSDWTPTMVKSALQTSTFEGVGNHDPADPATYWDTGTGRIQIDAAANVGLVLDESVTNYTDANPGSGGDPSTLNLPSLVSHICGGTCTWTRTFTSVLNQAATYTVVVEDQDGPAVTATPSTFTIPAGGTQTVTFSADVAGLPLDVWAYATVNLNTDATFPGGFAVTDQHLPVAVIPAETPPTISLDPESITSTQVVDTSRDYPLVISNLGTAPLTWSIFEDQAGGLLAPNLVDWSDNFDSYPTDTSLHGLGGWKGWGNSPAATAYTRDDQARSLPNSVQIVTTSDLVHEYSGYTSGTWTYSAWQYIPSTTTGLSYFILLNQYDDPGTNLNWSTQVGFDTDLGLVIAEGQVPAELPLILDQWVQIRVDIDLDADTQSFYYGGDLLYTSSWTEGMSGGGILNIGAVDLFGNTGDSVYYDDLSLSNQPPIEPACDAPSDLPWVSVAPTSGTTDPSGSSDVVVTFDTTGLTVGDTYSGTLCVASNDPENPVVPVPLAVTVLEDQPDIAVNPTTIDLTLGAGETQDVNVTVSNEGTLALDVTGITSVGDWPAWVTIPVTQTTVAPGASQDLVFTFDTAGLEPGTYTASFLIHSNDPDEPTVQVDINLTVAGSTEYKLFLPIIMKNP